MEQSRIKKILKYPWPNNLLLNMCRLATHFWPVTYLCSPKVVVVVVVACTTIIPPSPLPLPLDEDEE